jgi:ribosome biogenesis GTPase
MGDFSVARVTFESKGAYRVKNENGEYLAKITGKQIFKATSREDYPAVGDWVAITELDSERAVIHGILPRKTVIKRKYGDKIQIIAANIDVAFAVESADQNYNLNRFERYFAIARNGGVEPAIILNKIDLLSEEELDEILIQLKNRFPDIDIILTSIVSNKGLDDLKKYITKGKTYCFLGSSGVGKSSLINKLLGKNAIKTGDISLYSGKGKHITTARQMYFLKNGSDATVGAGGIVIDNPGMREVGMADMGKGIESFFGEIAVLARECKYADCSHVHEPGCEVINAVKSGKLDKGKYSNYISLKKEAEHFEMDDIEKREKDRQFGKFIKKAKRELKDIGHKG